MKSYDVRVYAIRKRPTKKISYDLRWLVERRTFSETFRTKGLADSRRAKLLAAAKDGEPFDTETGLPDSLAEAKETAVLTWFDFAVKYLAMKWPDAAPNSRDSINETLTAVTVLMLGERAGRPDAAVLRRALRDWAFVVRASDGPEVERPVEVAIALAWVERASRPLRDLADKAVMRAVLDGLKLRLDGKRAAAETVRRKRNVLVNAIGYALELGELEDDPIKALKWRKPPVSREVDPRVVVNPVQARDLLAAVSYVGSFRRCRGRRLVALFGCMYYCGLRPAEAVGLKRGDVELPDSGWGRMTVHSTRPTVGKRWTDTGEVHDRRGLKNRAVDEVRVVPVPPVLVKMLREHLAAFGSAADGRLFASERGTVLSSSTYWRVWDEARVLALTPDQVASPLAARPYDLRHAALSTWLNSGVDPTEVARRAGNSVEVLFSRYAKCLAGRQEIANQRIAEILGDQDDQDDNDDQADETD